MKTEVATFAGGCFWGMQKWFKHQFGEGLLGSQVGYIGGTAPNATYPEVCKGTTGHAEALQLTYNPATVAYEDLCEYFFRIHDPTQLNRQGGDIGTQYRSAIFPHSSEQERIAQSVLQRMNKEREGGKIVTTIDQVPASAFQMAEDYHQDYLVANPDGYCIHRPRW